MRPLGGLARSVYRNGPSIAAPVPRLTRRNLATEAKGKYPMITLEEHYIAKSVGEPKALSGAIYSQFPASIKEKLFDLDTQRIPAMDAGSISVQAISHVPADASAEVCTKANEELAEAVKRNPDRYAAFAMLPMSDPPAAAKELERCVTELGMVGAMIDNHLSDGTYFDGAEFWPVFEVAERLDVPLYIHPSFQPEERRKPFAGNYPKEVQTALAHWGFGWHATTATHVLRLFAAGVFDQYPKLKIAVGHMGELLPFQLERTDFFSKAWGPKKKDLKQVWDENIWITTSGMFSVNPMATVLRNTPLDHIMYSVDYPFEQNEKGLKFMEDLKESGLVNEEQFKAIAYKNAAKLLKINTPAV